MHDNMQQKYILLHTLCTSFPLFISDVNRGEKVDIIRVFE